MNLFELQKAEWKASLKNQRTIEPINQEIYAKMKGIKMDFHSYSLYEVKVWMRTNLPEFIEVGFDKIDIIHGYRNGTVIRDYIRSNLIIEFKKIYPTIKLVIFPIEKGRTIIRMKYIEKRNLN